MLYKNRSFTVPATGKTNLCAEKGKHSAADGRGCCMNCGEKVAPATERPEWEDALRRAPNGTPVVIVDRPGMHMTTTRYVLEEPGTHAHAVATCAGVGHMESDCHGRCLRCSAKVEPSISEKLNLLDDLVAEAEA